MNKKLIKYGIEEEESDLRAHVGSDKCIYVFKTEICRKLIKENSYKKVPAKQPNIDVVTAMGYLVPYMEVPLLRRVTYRKWKYWDSFDKVKDDTIRKGKFAVHCVTDAMKFGFFPFYAEAKQTNDIELDISGTDILVNFETRVQVKCDWPIGRTGNLFIQTMECNPLKRHNGNQKLDL